MCGCGIYIAMLIDELDELSALMLGELEIRHEWKERWKIFEGIDCDFWIFCEIGEEWVGWFDLVAHDAVALVYGLTVSGW